jgi:asparagine synthase (glutamine-hydrolysing)
MCGIVGIFGYKDSSPHVDRNELLSIRDHMTARGPDSCGEWMSLDDKMALAHRRLTIIDLSQSGNQPMPTDDGRFIISFNGEIYNYKDLRSSLIARGVQFKTASDTEVLLEMYRGIWRKNVRSSAWHVCLCFMG